VQCAVIAVTSRTTGCIQRARWLWPRLIPGRVAVKNGAPPVDFQVTSVPRHDLQLELHLDSNPRLVSVVRRFIEEALEKVVDDDQDLVGRLSMAAHELVENGVKYALCDPTVMRIALEQGPGGIRARIAITNQASVENVDRLRAIVADIARTGRSELPELYENYLRRREMNGNSAGVGLVRIRAEAEMSIDCEVTGSMVTIVATALVQRRSP
jgi:hypothetical protein